MHKASKCRGEGGHQPTGRGTDWEGGRAQLRCWWGDGGSEVEEVNIYSDRALQLCMPRPGQAMGVAAPAEWAGSGGSSACVAGTQEDSAPAEGAP